MLWTWHEVNTYKNTYNIVDRYTDIDILLSSNFTYGFYCTLHKLLIRQVRQRFAEAAEVPLWYWWLCAALSFVAFTVGGVWQIWSLWFWYLKVKVSDWTMFHHVRPLAPDVICFDEEIHLNFPVLIFLYTVILIFPTSLMGADVHLSPKPSSCGILVRPHTVADFLTHRGVGINVSSSC